MKQTFNRLQAIVNHLEFMDIEIGQDDLNQKFLTSLPPEWLMHTIVWRNRSDLDTMSLDDLYNHLKVGNEEVNTASIPTASTYVSPASANIRAVSISQDTACAYISQIKFEDITQIDEDDIEEMDIKWNMALLSMRAGIFWKKIGKKISIQGTDVAGFDKSKVECFNCHKLGHFSRECRAPKSQDRGRRDNHRQGSKVEEQAPKALMAIDGTRLLEFADDTVTDYSMPSHAIESTSDELQNRNPSVTESGASPTNIASKSFIKKFPTGNIKFSTADMGNKGKAVKASACWIWKPSQNLSNKGPNRNSVSVMFKKYTCIDTQGKLNGCSRHMTGNISYLSDYELYDGGYVSFGQGGCKITSKGTIKIGKFKAKGDEGCFLGYSMSSKAIRVFNKRTNRVEENLHVDFLENKPIEKGAGLNCSLVPTACLDVSLEPSSDTRLISKRVTSQDDTQSLENILTLTNRFEDILGVSTNTDDTNGVEADLGNMEDNISASPTPTLRIHKDHLKTQIIVHVDTPVQTRTKSKEVEEQSFIATIHQKTNPALLQFCLFSWVRPIGTKWVLKNKKDKRWIVIRNKARLVAQWHTQEERIDYDEVFAPVARIEAIRLFLAYALFMGFTVYQIDVKSAFLYGTIDEEVYVVQPPGFQDPEFPARVYKVEKAMYGLHQAPRAWYGTLSKYLLTNGFQRGTIDQTLFIRRQRGDFILVQVYVDDIIFGSSNPQLSREFEAFMHEKFQMSAMDELNFFLVKRIFRYLKGHPKLGLWYPKESPFDLVAYSDSDYGGTFKYWGVLRILMISLRLIPLHSSTRTHQAATRNRGKAIVNSPQPIYDQEPSMVDDDDETSKEKEIDKLMDLISLSFKKIYKPTNNNLRTSSNTSRAHQDNSPRIHRNAGYESQRSGNVAGAMETVGSSMV
nr:putative ribonuclease H-like domain-containing protein [Tanacetum cinerariifolium]